MDVKTGAIKV